MKRFCKPRQVRLIVAVFLAVTVAFAVAGDSSTAPLPVEMTGQVKSLSITGGMDYYSRLPTAAPLLPLEPALTEIANRFAAIPNFSGITTAGKQLTVTLNQSGSAAQKQFNRTRPKPTRPAVSGSGRRITSMRSKPRTVSGSRLTASSASLVDEIKCTQFPDLCKDIILIDPNNPTAPPTLKLTNVKPRVEWSIFDRNDRNTPLTDGSDFHSEKLQGLSKLFVMAPLTATELTPSTPPANDYVIVAKVSLTADRVSIGSGVITPVKSAEIPLEVPLTMSALEVPTIFVLFMDKNFGRAAAAYVPGNSTLTQTMLPDAVRKLADIYNPVASRLNFVTWFAAYLAGLQGLQHTFALEHWDLKELKDGEWNLNNDDFIHRSPFTSLNDSEVEDESSSLLMMGIPGTAAKFFQDRSSKGLEFSVRTGLEMTVLIRDFATMSSEPAGGVCNNTYAKVGKTPNDSLSAFKWRLNSSGCPVK
jgi:hypothetical protein